MHISFWAGYQDLATILTSIVPVTIQNLVMTLSLVSQLHDYLTFRFRCFRAAIISCNWCFLQDWRAIMVWRGSLTMTSQGLVRDSQKRALRTRLMIIGLWFPREGIRWICLHPSRIVLWLILQMTSWKMSDTVVHLAPSLHVQSKVAYQRASPGSSPGAPICHTTGKEEFPIHESCYFSCKAGFGRWHSFDILICYAWYDHSCALMPNTVFPSLKYLRSLQLKKWLIHGCWYDFVKCQYWAYVLSFSWRTLGSKSSKRPWTHPHPYQSTCSSFHHTSCSILSMCFFRIVASGRCHVWIQLLLLQFPFLFSLDEAQNWYFFMGKVDPPTDLSKLNFYLYCPEPRLLR